MVVVGSYGSTINSMLLSITAGCDNVIFSISIDITIKAL